MSELSPSERRLSLAAVMLHMMGIGLTLGLLFPLTSLTLESWGSDASIIGLAGAMSPLAILCLMPFLPRVARRLGAVRAMVIGCTVAALMLGAMYLVQSVPFWVAGRFVIGAGLALPWLVGDVWINQVVSERDRGRTIGVYVAGFFGGFATGPVLLEAIGVGGPLPHALGVGALMLASLPLVLVAKLAPEIEADAAGGILASVRAVPIVAAGAFVAGFTESAAFALLPIWALARGLGETGALHLLALFIGGGVLLQLTLGVVADRLDRHRLMVGVGVALAVAAAALALVAGAAIYAVAFVVGGLVLASYALSLTLLGERFRAAELAVASAAFLVVYQLGSVSGPVMVGAAMARIDAAGFTWGLAVPGVLLALAAVFWGASPPPARRRDQAWC